VDCVPRRGVFLFHFLIRTALPLECQDTIESMLQDHAERKAVNQVLFGNRPKNAAHGFNLIAQGQ
jgi:hypothetical protein